MARANAKKKVETKPVATADHIAPEVAWPPYPPLATAVPEEEVRRLAYQKWVTAGHPPGDGIEFWLAAELELRQRAAAPR
jgi:hypothetical protein